MKPSFVSPWAWTKADHAFGRFVRAAYKVGHTDGRRKYGEYDEDAERKMFDELRSAREELEAMIEPEFWQPLPATPITRAGDRG